MTGAHRRAIGRRVRPREEQAVAAPARSSGKRGAAQARWARNLPSDLLAFRRPLVPSHEEIRRDWDRIAAVAVDFIQNSGRLRGAIDQVIADTVGTELKLNARPDLGAAGYTPAESAAWARMVEGRWRRWAWDPRECDARGKLALPQLVDIALRHQIAYGETLALVEYLAPARRRAVGCESGTKLMLLAPDRLVRETSVEARLFAGVLHDATGRVRGYRLREPSDLGPELHAFARTRDVPARDADGRQLVLHVFDPWDAGDTRGVSVLAAALRTHAHSEKLADATLTTAILQTVFAAALTSPEPSLDAFQALETLNDLEALLPPAAEGGGDEPLQLLSNYLALHASHLEASGRPIALDGTARISHLAPGEKLELLSAQAPTSQYVPFSNHLLRDMARCLGITFEALSMNNENASYSSVRMSNSSIWPVVLRRRERIAAPFCQAVYEAWLDEEVGEGRLPFRGGYGAFRAHRAAASWAEWQGPAKPTADDYKSARAATERLQNGTTTLAFECAEMGLDRNDVIAMRREEMLQLQEAGLPDVFRRVQGGGGAPAGAELDA